jgi:TPR repeat protein
LSLPDSPAASENDGQSLQGVDQNILQAGRFFLLAADTGNSAALALGGFLALETEHAHVKNLSVGGPWERETDSGMQLVPFCPIFQKKFGHFCLF